MGWAEFNLAMLSVANPTRGGKIRFGSFYSNSGWTNKVRFFLKTLHAIAIIYVHVSMSLTPACHLIISSSHLSWRNEPLGASSNCHLKKKQHSLGAFFGNLLVIGALNAFDVFDLIQVWGIRSAQQRNDNIPFVYIYIYKYSRSILYMYTYSIIYVYI